MKITNYGKFLCLRVYYNALRILGSNRSDTSWTESVIGSLNLATGSFDLKVQEIYARNF